MKNKLLILFLNFCPFYSFDIQSKQININQYESTLFEKATNKETCFTIKGN